MSDRITQIRDEAFSQFGNGDDGNTPMDIFEIGATWADENPSHTKPVEVTQDVTEACGRSDERDCGGNRPYDYISLEEHNAAELSLKTKTHWRELTTHEIVVLRSKAKDFGLLADVVDRDDRLDLIRCLFFWMKCVKARPVSEVENLKEVKRVYMMYC